MLEYCYNDDGYTIHQDTYQLQDHEYHPSPHPGMQMRPPPQHSQHNIMMSNGNYYHYAGFPAKTNYHQNGYHHGQSMYQNGYPGSAGSDGFYMSQVSVGGKPPAAHHNMSNASQHHFSQNGGGGFNSTMMSNTDEYYDNYNNKVRPRPVTMMQGASMGHDQHGNWGNATNGYRYNNQMAVTCMPYNGYNHSDDQRITKSL